MPRGRSTSAFPVPNAGLIANVPLHQIPANAAATGSNLVVDTDGLLKARPGFSPVATPGPGGRIMGGIGFANANGNLAGVVSNLTEWWHFDGTAWVNITDPANPQNGSPDLPTRFIAFFQGTANKVFAAGVNGINPMRAWSPGDAIYRTVAAAPIARDICAVSSRALVVNTTEPDPDGGPIPLRFPFRVRWSAVDDGTTWPALASADLFDSDAPLIASRTFGRLTAAIYAESSVWLAVAQAGDDANAFGFQQIPGYTSGPMSSAAVVVVDNVHYYYGRDNRIWRFDGVHCDPISAFVDSVLGSEFSPDSPFFARIHGCYDPALRSLMFWYPPGTATDPSKAIVYNLDYNRFETLWQFDRGITTSFTAQRRQLLVPFNVYIGTADGQVDTFGRDTSDAGVAIPYRLESYLYRVDQAHVSLPESIAVFFKYRQGQPECVKVSIYGYHTPGTPGTLLWSVKIDVSEPDQYDRRITPQKCQDLSLGWEFLQLVIEGSSTLGGMAYMGSDFYTSPQQRPVGIPEDKILVTCPPDTPPPCLFLLEDSQGDVFAVDFNATPPAVTVATDEQKAEMPVYAAIAVQEGVWLYIVEAGILLTTHTAPAGPIVSNPCVPPVGEFAIICPSSVVTGLGVDFTATPPEGVTISNYHWVFGDGNTADTGSTPTVHHDYASSQIYAVSLTAVADTGATATASGCLVNVNPAGQCQGPHLLIHELWENTLPGCTNLLIRELWES